MSLQQLSHTFSSNNILSIAAAHSMQHTFTGGFKQDIFQPKSLSSSLPSIFLILALQQLPQVLKPEGLGAKKSPDTSSGNLTSISSFMSCNNVPNAFVQQTSLTNMPLQQGVTTTADPKRLPVAQNLLHLIVQVIGVQHERGHLVLLSLAFGLLVGV